MLTAWRDLRSNPLLRRERLRRRARGRRTLLLCAALAAGILLTGAVALAGPLPAACAASGQVAGMKSATPAGVIGRGLIRMAGFQLIWPGMLACLCGLLASAMFANTLTVGMFATLAWIWLGLVGFQCLALVSEGGEAARRIYDMGA